MFARVRALLREYREAVLYLVFGGLTTGVNFLSYLLLTRLLAVSELPATALAWFLSVVFAYLTNKVWVFESRSWRVKTLFREAASFFGCRLFSGILDMGVMFLFVSVLGWNDVAVKLASNVIVIVLNYLFSKLWIFKKEKPEDKAPGRTDTAG